MVLLGNTLGGTPNSDHYQKREALLVNLFQRLFSLLSEDIHFAPKSLDIPFFESLYESGDITLEG